MLNELVLASNYESTIKFLDKQVSHNSKCKDQKDKINIEKIMYIISSNSESITSDKNENNNDIQTNKDLDSINTDTENTDIEDNTFKYIKETKEINQQYTTQNNINTKLDIKEENNKELQERKCIKKIDNLSKEIKEKNNIQNKNFIEIKINNNNENNKIKNTITKTIPINIEYISKHSTYVNRNPTTLWKSIILSKIYLIIKRIYYYNRYNNNCDLNNIKNVILSSLKEIGIKNLSIESIDNKVVKFLDENGKLYDNQIVSEKSLQKNLSKYNIDKKSSDNNMLLFILIYLVKQLEDEMKMANLYPSGLKKKQNIINIVNKFNSWNKGEFLSENTINNNSINKFMDYLRNKKTISELDTIINLCLCRFTKLN